MGIDGDINQRYLNFALCFDDPYAQYAAVCMKSITNQHDGYYITFYILSDYLSSQSIQRLEEAVELHTNCIIKVIIVDNQIFHELPLNIWPVQAWYRILLPELLPVEVEKVLYLDCDTMVLSALSSLFNINMEGKAYAAIMDPQAFKEETFVRCAYPMGFGYICSGIMLLNLKFWRDENVKEKLIKYALANRAKIKFPDQDCLNSVFYDKRIILPYNYGVMDTFFKNQDALHAIPKNELQKCLDSPMIIHFAGCAPWIRELRPSLFSREWDKINNTLKHKAKKRYFTRGMLFAKMIGYKVLHPILTYKKRINRLTLNKAHNLVSNKS